MLDIVVSKMSITFDTNCLKIANLFGKYNDLPSVNCKFDYEFSLKKILVYYNTELTYEGLNEKSLFISNQGIHFFYITSESNSEVTETLIKNIDFISKTDNIAVIICPKNDPLAINFKDRFVYFIENKQCFSDVILIKFISTLIHSVFKTETLLNNEELVQFKNKQPINLKKTRSKITVIDLKPYIPSNEKFKCDLKK